MWLFVATARFDFGLGDPNKSGAIVAMGMAALAAVAFTKARGSWLAGVGWIFLAYFLLLTQSRGGLLAALMGSASAFFCHRAGASSKERADREGVGKTVFLLSVALCGLLVVFLFGGAFKRWENIAEDRSAGGRVEIWRAWPGMLVAAPSGWGADNAAEAYHQWYQPVDRPERYRHLLSSHATWMAEAGWLGRWLYIAGWGTVFVLCWRRPETGEDQKVLSGKFAAWLFPAAFGVWVAFAVAAVFSHVAESWVVWILPGAFLLAVVGARAMLQDWPRPASLAKCWGGAAVIVGGLWLAGSVGQSGLEIRRKNEGSIVVGAGEPAVWVLVEPAAMGKDYGKTLRRFWRDGGPGGAIGVTNDVGSIPEEARLCLINPRERPERFAGRDARAWFGEFSQSPVRVAWEEDGRATIVEGVGDFVPEWPRLVFSAVTK